MRSTFAWLVAFSVVISGCHCGPKKLTSLEPKLVIVQPTARDGSDWLMSFGTVKASATAKVSLPIQIDNEGQLPGSVTSAVLRAGSDPALSLSAPAFPQDVEAGASLTLQVNYEPRAQGTATGFVDLATDDPQLPTATVKITASSQAGDVQVCVQDPATSQWTCSGLQAAPLAIDFGLALIGAAPVQRQVQVRNIGTADLQYLGTALVAGSSAEFSIAPVQNPAPPGTTLAANANVQFAIQFNPTASGAATGTAMVSSSDAITPVINIQLKARAAVSMVCHIDVSPPSIDFGAVPTNGFAQQTLVIVDDGLQPCQLTGLNPTGAAFTVVQPPTLPLTLQPNGVTTVGINYVPSGTTGDTGNLAVVSNDPVNPTINVPLKGTGAAPAPCQIEAVPGSIAFGQVGVGQIVTQTLTLHNFGTSTCVLLSIGMANGSSSAYSAFIGALTPPVINSGGTLGVTVQYAPHQAQTDTGTVAILASNLVTTRVPVSGTAIAPCLSLTPPELDFNNVPVGQTRDLTFQASNCGTTQLEVRGLYIQGGSSPAFLLPSPLAMPATIAPGGTDTVTVRYAPSSTTGDFGQVVVASNDGTNPTSFVRLTGNVASFCGPTLNCTPGSLTFPVTNTGQTSTLTFSCTNVGAVPVSLTPPNPIHLQGGSAAAFSLSVPAIGSSLQPGQSVRIAVDFSPTVAGGATGHVEIDSNDCRTPAQVIALTATGQVPNYPPCPTPHQFKPVTKWTWNGSSNAPFYSGVDGQPMVAPLIDTNGDGLVNENDVPAVIFASSNQMFIGNPDAGIDPSPPGVMRAIRGDNGQEIWSITDAKYRVVSTHSPAVADIDGDNVPEVVIGLYYESPGQGLGGMMGKFIAGRLICFKADGSVKWISDWWTNGSTYDIEDDSAISIADLDGDGVPEIIYGSAVFDADGKLLWQGTQGRGNMGHGAVSAIADLDGDGRPEVVAGNTAYHWDGSVYWNWGKNDALPLVVDVDGDGQPEVVLRTDYNQYVVLNHDGTVKYGPITFNVPSQDANGNDVSICSATITAADFDGDGHPEIGIPAGIVYYMFKPDGTQMFSWPIEDYVGQCGAAGTGAFDFFGKGQFEAVYNDAENVYAFNGVTGAVDYQMARSSATIIEVPVIADLDHDGHADILVTQSVKPAIVALNNTDNDWPETRGIWNQHTYHVTNVSAGGAIPRVEGPGWKTFNAYRANVTLCK